MKLIFFFLMFSWTAHSATEWVYYLVGEGETLESISLSLHGTKKAFQDRLALTKLPKPGKYFKLPADLIRLECNANYSPRSIKSGMGIEKVRQVSAKHKLKSQSDLYRLVRSNSLCIDNLRPWRRYHTIAYVLSNDSLEEDNDGVSTQTNVLSYAGVEYFGRMELGWINPWVISLRGKIVKGEAAEGFTLGPQVDVEVGLGKVLTPNKQSVYFKYWRNQFDFVGDKDEYIGSYTNTSNLIGVSYEHIFVIHDRPWLGQMGAYYNLKSDFTPEVNGQEVDLSGYALRFSLKIPIAVGGANNLFVEPGWQYLNFSGNSYTLNYSQLFLAGGLRF